MKILIDGRLYGLENAGLGRYLINLVGELTKLDKKNEYILLLRKKYFEGLKLPPNWKKVLADFRHYSFWEQIRLPFIISREKPDIVHFPHFNVPLLYGGRFVVTIHDMLMHRFPGLAATTLPAPLYFVRQLAYRIDFMKAVKGSLKIIVPSQSVKLDILKKFNLKGDRIEVIYEGADENIHADAGSKKVLQKYNLENPYFIYTGNAYPHKNLERLIEAVKLLNLDSSVEIELAVISARSVFIERLSNAIKRLRAEEYVKLLGFVPDEDLGSLYKNSTAFAFPSLSEGFGLPGLEAMNSGALVLASDIPVFKEIYGKNAIYFNPLDFNSIEESMKNVLEMDKSVREERIEKAKEFVKKYSWVKMAKETLNIYESSFGLR